MISFFSKLRTRRELKRFNDTPAASRTLVFYAHSSQDWLVLEPIILELTHEMKTPVSYVTRDLDDPIRHMPPLSIHPFFIADGPLRTHFLEQIECDTLVVCNHEALERPFPVSAKVKNYTFLCPNLKSVLPTAHPDNLRLFRTWLCAAQHQLIDLINTCTKVNPSAHVFPCGSTRLDRTIRMMKESKSGSKDPIPTVFFYFTHSNIEYRDSIVARVLALLLEAKLRVVFKPPHRWLDHKRGSLLRPIFDQFSHNDLFVPDGEQAFRYSISRADCLVTDDPNLAVELSLALDYPVIFIDIGGDGAFAAHPAIVSSFQGALGAIVSLSSLDLLPSAVQTSIDQRKVIAGRANAIRETQLLNQGRCAPTAALILTQRTHPPAKTWFKAPIKPQLSS